MKGIKTIHIKGVFCISLDFEKYWGVHDVKNIGEAQLFRHTTAVVNGLLTLFERYDTHVTWATVGLLGHENLTELISNKNLSPIPYENLSYSPFPLTSEKYGDFDPALLSAKEEITSIINASNQELASHTFSHFYCCEAGVTTTDFLADCEEMALLEKKWSTSFKSIVFPRNQLNEDYLETCAKFNISAYRGNQENRFWRNSSFQNESFLKKAGRVIDAYWPIAKTNAYTLANLPQLNGLLNIPANRFFRPYSGKKWMEKRKIKRIKNEMFKAAKNGWIYHLWWHPHNFVNHPKESLNQIEELLAYAQVLNKKFDFVSLNMSEITAHAKK